MQSEQGFISANCLTLDVIILYPTVILPSGKDWGQVYREQGEADTVFSSIWRSAWGLAEFPQNVCIQIGPQQMLVGWRNEKIAFAALFCCCCLVAKFCPTLCNPTDYTPRGSSVHGISQARRLEWVAISFSRGISLIWGSNLHLLHWQADSLQSEPPGKPLKVTDQLFYKRSFTWDILKFSSYD